MYKKKAIIVSGYFNPLHRGHLELLQKCSQIGDEVWVIVNSDLQRELKGSKPFMDQEERLEIISAIKYVSRASISVDQDKTQCETLKVIASYFGKAFKLYFANGGDQTNESIPEYQTCIDNDIQLVDGLGEKVQSSSWLLSSSDSD